MPNNQGPVSHLASPTYSGMSVLNGLLPSLCVTAVMPCDALQTQVNGFICCPASIIHHSVQGCYIWQDQQPDGQDSDRQVHHLNPSP